MLRLEARLGLDVEHGVQAALSGFGTLTTLANCDCDCVCVCVWGHRPMIVTTVIWLAVRHRAVFRVQRLLG